MFISLVLALGVGRTFDFYEVQPLQLFASLARWRLSWQHLDDLQDNKKVFDLEIERFDSRQLSQISMKTEIEMP